MGDLHLPDERRPDPPALGETDAPENVSGRSFPFDEEPTTRSPDLTPSSGWLARRREWWPPACREAVGGDEVTEESSVFTCRPSCSPSPKRAALGGYPCPPWRERLGKRGPKAGR